MQAYQAYVDSVESFIASGEAVSAAAWRRQASLSLNGEPSRKLRSAVAIEDLRASGAFFTGHELARRAVAGLWKKAKGQAVFFDPACGSGDLLLAVARKLPLRGTPQATVASWGRLLAGCDVHPEFVHATRLRLVLLALQRHGSRQNLVECQHAFTLIRVADGLNETDLYRNADCIIMNPPFCHVDCPNEVDWASGKVNVAAIFVTTAIAKIRDGAHVTAILPDVLRSGSRYAKWREHVVSVSGGLSVQPHGLFDRWADVDVFSLEMEVSKGCSRRTPPSASWGTASRGQRKTIGDLFDVHVGAVVPHRHKRKGPARSFIHARSLPKWRCAAAIRESRRFAGTTFEAPFVAVQRTSSPSDAKRAVATMVTAPGPIAVENHLLVLRPKDGQLDRCRQLMRLLRSKNADEWLNKRIRCRHLTVTALREMPWVEGATT